MILEEGTSLSKSVEGDWVATLSLMESAVVVGVGICRRRMCMRKVD